MMRRAQSCAALALAACAHATPAPSATPATPDDGCLAGVIGGQRVLVCPGTRPDTEEPGGYVSTASTVYVVEGAVRRELGRIATSLGTQTSVEGVPVSAQPRFDLDVELTPGGAGLRVAEHVPGSCTPTGMHDRDWARAIASVCRSQGLWVIRDGRLVRGAPKR